MTVGCFGLVTLQYSPVFHRWNKGWQRLSERKYLNKYMSAWYNFSYSCIPYRQCSPPVEESCCSCCSDTWSPLVSFCEVQSRCVMCFRICALCSPRVMLVSFYMLYMRMDRGLNSGKPLVKQIDFSNHLQELIASVSFLCEYLCVSCHSESMLEDNK